jgi:gas vesicle protein
MTAHMLERHNHYDYFPSNHREKENFGCQSLTGMNENVDQFDKLLTDLSHKVSCIESEQENERRKRKCTDNIVNELMNLMRQFRNETTGHMENLVSRVVSQQENEKKKQKFTDKIMSHLLNLTQQFHNETSGHLKNLVSHIVSNQENERLKREYTDNVMSHLMNLTQQLHNETSGHVKNLGKEIKENLNTTGQHLSLVTAEVRTHTNIAMDNTKRLLTDGKMLLHVI